MIKWYTYHDFSRCRKLSRYTRRYIIQFKINDRWLEHLLSNYCANMNSIKKYYNS
ncbi:hypothetical protein Lalb_Chr18g0049851 [Lupinus albus]|uniref:Uncharacterized protein n=1 Tax=Lupinus albus TaxID=3870 RepID=A0A6A4P3A1_LUPAL|nr:hypothetical protein Lalb_Chr18g0049851 [Lupinus albus]